MGEHSVTRHVHPRGGVTDSVLSPLSLTQPARYRITVQGWLDETWTAWFAGMTITHIGAHTTLAGVIQDQAALHGLLAQVRDLGLPLLVVQCLAPAEDDDTDTLSHTGY